MSEPEHPFHTAFDLHLPTYLDALYVALQDTFNKTQQLHEGGHDCNCEFCDEETLGEVPESNYTEYNALRDEALEIASTIRRMIRWAAFKKIELKKPEKDYYVDFYTPEEL